MMVRYPLMTMLSLGVTMVSLPVAVSECGDTGGGDPKPAELEHYPIFHNNSPLDEAIPADAEVDPNSDLYVARMVSVAESVDFLMTLNEYAAPVYYADETTPRYDVFLDAYGTYGYCGMQYLLDVPIPSFAEADPGSDAHMMVVDKVGGCAYDFWGYNQNVGAPTPNSWWASGVAIDSTGIYQDTTGAGSAANFSYINGAVWPDEIETGYIPHALTFSFDYLAVKAGGPVLPATHSDGTSTDVDAMPEGTRVQLDPSLDLDSLGLESYEYPIARALQEFGMYLVDGSGGPIALTGISGISADPNPWTGLVPDPEASKVYLSNIPVDRFRVLRIPEQYTPEGGCNDNPCGMYQPAP